MYLIATVPPMEDLAPCFGTLMWLTWRWTTKNLWSSQESFRTHHRRNFPLVVLERLVASGELEAYEKWSAVRFRKEDAVQENQRKMDAEWNWQKSPATPKAKAATTASVRGVPARVLKPHDRVAAAASSRPELQPPGTYAWTPTPETVGPQLASLFEEPTAADEQMREGLELAAVEERRSKAPKQPPPARPSDEHFSRVPLAGPCELTAAEYDMAMTLHTWGGTAGKVATFYPQARQLNSAAPVVAPMRSRTDHAQPVTQGWKAQIPPEVYNLKPSSPRVARRWSAEKSSASQSSTTVISGNAPKEQIHEVISPTEEFDPSTLPTTIPESDLPLDASAPLSIHTSSKMLARAAKLVCDEEQMAGRMQVLSSMLERDGDNMQGETLVLFEKLYREMKEEFFELDSQTQTVKQFLGKCDKQDSETIELVGKHKVPQNVYLFLRFLAAKGDSAQASPYLPDRRGKSLHETVETEVARRNQTSHQALSFWRKDSVG